MYKLYERIQKSTKNPLGIRMVEETRNPFQDGPCLLCISAVNLDKSVFGMSKEGMKAARLRVRGKKNAGFTLEEFPVKFLSMKSELKKGEENLTEEQQIEEFVNIYLVPLISENGQKINVTTAMKNMRNVNVMCYCDGTLRTQQMETQLIEKMQQLGYTEEECNQIQSQMCIVPIATDRLNGKQKSTCISFKDINDSEVSNNVTEKEKQTVNNSTIGEAIFKYSDNEMAYLYNGSGEHSLKEYQIGGKAMPVCLSKVVSRVLENSIENATTDSFKPISIKELVNDMKTIMQNAKKGMTLEQLRQELDESLTYGNARRVSDFEAELLDQLDEVCDENARMQKELKRAEKSADDERKKREAIESAAKQHCSAATYWKLRIAGGYQIGLKSGFTHEEVMNAPSDKEIVKAAREYEGRASQSVVTIADMANADRQYKISGSDMLNAAKVIDNEYDKGEKNG